MNRFNIVPIAPLRPYVERLWGWESIGQEIVELPTLLPGTGAEIFFHYRMPFSQVREGKDHVFDGAHLVCVRRRPIQLSAQRDIGFIAVRLRAGRMHRFVDIPGGDLIDRTLSVTELWKSAGRQLSLDVSNAPSKAGALEALQCFLFEQLRRNRSDELVENAISVIYRHHAAASIDKLASRFGVTRRELERRFKTLTAQTPVEFRKLSRIQHVMRELLLDPSARILDAALSHGFYDQAHFIHAFAELALGSPVQHLTLARAKPHFYNISLRDSASISAKLSSAERDCDVLATRRDESRTVCNGGS
ncbi:helix-turn-helix domain-containing protein [Bradyrhizobium sp. 153]|uniref:AraC family transcriptional regulator n=1 Tax=Bradyrhizobium sp. 153 TaxID=2782627 RepID=UPI001FF73B90|nr:helix-turn-helix domain-containing protein [Bradyrhizobium sp. 153]MCK1667717.1 AraC family transcriptional regulator [Bradyrhizobium sp. 153]